MFDAYASSFIYRKKSMLHLNTAARMLLLHIEKHQYSIFEIYVFQEPLALHQNLIYNRWAL